MVVQEKLQVSKKIIYGNTNNYYIIFINCNEKWHINFLNFLLKISLFMLTQIIHSKESNETMNHCDFSLYFQPYVASLCYLVEKKAADNCKLVCSEGKSLNCSYIRMIYCRKTLFELKTKFSSPARVECSLPPAQPLFNTRTAARAGSPVTRVPST